MHAATGLSLDMYLPHSNLVFEVDGPFHFASNCREQLGSTVLKQRLIRNLGLLLCVVPYWEWEEAGKEKRGMYLQRLIERVS